MPHRFRRPAGSLNRDVAVGAALALADRDGMSGVTIRALAAALDVAPMTLYSTFASKNELLDLMYSEVVNRLFVDVRGQPWQAALRSVGSQMHVLLTEHPNWAPLLSRPAPPLRSSRREELLEALLSAGMPPAQAFVALSTVVLSSLGLMLVELELRAASGGSGVTERLEALREHMDAQPPSGQPLMREAIRRLDSLQLGHLHEQALDLLIRGCETQLTR